MILETILVGLLVISIVVVPVVATTWYNNRRIRLYGHHMVRLAISKHQLNLHKTNPVGKRMVSWDDERDILLIIDANNKNQQVLQLASAKNCLLIKNHIGTMMTSLVLQFTNQTGDTVGNAIIYKYHSENHMKMDQIFAQAKEWELWLNQRFINKGRTNYLIRI